MKVDQIALGCAALLFHLHVEAELVTIRSAPVAFEVSGHISASDGLQYINTELPLIRYSAKDGLLLEQRYVFKATREFDGVAYWTSNQGGQAWLGERYTFSGTGKIQGTAEDDGPIFSCPTGTRCAAAPIKTSSITERIVLGSRKYTERFNSKEVLNYENTKLFPDRATIGGKGQLKVEVQVFANRSANMQLTGKLNGEMHQEFVFRPWKAEEIFSGGLTPSVLKGGVDAIVVPNFGFNINEAAEKLGYDHFNWIQNITAIKYDGEKLKDGDFLSNIVRTGGVDPLPGGNSVFEKRDREVFYWDVGDVIDPDYHSGANMNVFSDMPNLLIKGLSADFETFFVGVKKTPGGFSYDYIKDAETGNRLGFTWNYLQTKYFSDGCTTIGAPSGSPCALQNTSPELSGGGEVTITSVNGIPRIESSIPESSIFALIAAGLFTIASFLRMPPHRIANFS